MIHRSTSEVNEEKPGMVPTLSHWNNNNTVTDTVNCKYTHDYTDFIFMTYSSIQVNCR